MNKILSIPILLFLLFQSNLTAQNLWFSQSDGDFSDVTIWRDLFNNPATTLSPNDGFSIAHTVTLDQNMTVRSVAIGAGSLTIPSPLTLTADGSPLEGVWVNQLGTLTIDAGATVNISNSEDAGLEVSPSGQLVVNGILHISNSGDGGVFDDGLVIYNNVAINGTVTIDNIIGGNGIAVVGSADLLITGTGSVTITEDGGADNGVLIEDDDASMTINIGGSLSVSGFASDGIDAFVGEVSNAGTITIDDVGEDGIYNGDTFVNTGSVNMSNIGLEGINNVSSSSFTNSGNISIHTVVENGIRTVANSIMTNTAGGSVLIENVDAAGITGPANSTFENEGILQVSNLMATYSGNLALNNTGTLKGEGTFTANALTLALGSVVAPGSSPGQMDFDGNTNFSNTTLAIEVEAMNSHDVVMVAGTATLGGALNASILYTPVSTERVVFLTATSISGTLSLNTALPAGWTVDYSVSGEVAFLFTSLPVELLDFSVQKNNKNVLLKWRTASETNNKGFEIEHSRDGRSWNDLGFMQGNGNAFEIKEYTFQDDRPANGINYYRLRQVDFDGRFEYSETRSIRLDNLKDQIQVFPNPASSQFNIQITQPFDEANIRIDDMAGRTLFEKKWVDRGGPFPIDLENWRPGVYLLLIDIDGRLQSQKLVVSNH